MPVKEWIVQKMVKLVIEPIFKAQLSDVSYGFRPNRNQRQTLRSVKRANKKDDIHMVDADIKCRFGNMPHDKLIIQLEKIITDFAIL
jgi:retron-type reverse transcriptase